ncbi:hypothetical protein SEA_BOBBY_77 [Mycobacterium phage Bobby]|nr:hypothetical protein SEA_BOBBY_77 [Mycobacterium phage Bobby]
MSDRILDTIASPIRECWGPGSPHEHVAMRILAALKANRIALVELPEPSYLDDPEGNLEPGGAGFNGGPADSHLSSERGVYAFQGMVYDQWDGVTPADARKIGGWWLAAAEHAEAYQ